MEKEETTSAREWRSRLKIRRKIAHYGDLNKAYRWVPRCIKKVRPLKGQEDARGDYTAFINSPILGRIAQRRASSRAYSLIREFKRARIISRERYRSSAFIAFHDVNYIIFEADC